MTAVEDTATPADLHLPVDGLPAPGAADGDRTAWLAAARAEATGEATGARGRSVARARLDALVDPDSFVELGAFRRGSGRGLSSRRFYSDGVVTGFGLVDGREVALFSQDRAVFGGSQGVVFSDKVCEVLALGASSGAPVVGIFDGGGARLQEGPIALAGYGRVFRGHMRASGVVPQVSVLLGPCAGGAAYAPALTDFIVMDRTSARMFVTGPRVVAGSTGEAVDEATYGGATMHATRSGVCHLVADGDEACLDAARDLLSLLPPNNGELPPHVPTADRADRPCAGAAAALPPSPSMPYDVRAVVDDVLDRDGPLLEITPDWARNIVCGLGRIDGHPVGIVANQPAHLAGALDVDASAKAARFVRTCDAFNLPLVTFVDVPGFLPGVDQETRGIIRHGASLLHAYGSATTARISVILRKAVGGAYIVMDSKGIGADLTFAWPSNEISVMAPSHAAAILFRRELSGADPGADPAADDVHRRLTDRYGSALVHPLAPASEGLVDDVIEPAATRWVLARSLRLLRAKREEHVPRKHGNLPL